LQSRKGPEYYREQEVFSYLAKNQKKALITWIAEDGRMESLFERDRSSLDVQKHIPYLLSEKMIGTVGFSKEIVREIRKGYQVSDGSKIFRASKGKPNWLAKEVLSIISEE
jgi:hypothetical protein